MDEINVVLTRIEQVFLYLVKRKAHPVCEGSSL